MYAISQEVLEYDWNGISNGRRAWATEPSLVQQSEYSRERAALASMVCLRANEYVWLRLVSSPHFHCPDFS